MNSAFSQYRELQRQRHELLMKTAKASDVDIADATASMDGLVSAEDRARIDSLEDSMVSLWEVLSEEERLALSREASDQNGTRRLFAAGLSMDRDKLVRMGRAERGRMIVMYCDSDLNLLLMNGRVLRVRQSSSEFTVSTSDGTVVFREETK